MTDSVELLDEALVAMGLIFSALEIPWPEEQHSFQDLRIQYQRKKSTAGGNRFVCEQLGGLSEYEFKRLEDCFKELARAESAGGESALRREALRFFNWFDSVGNRKMGLHFQPMFSDSDSEDLGLRQVRAVELILRALVSDHYGSQELLEARLRTLFKAEAVEDWLSKADPGNLLSGTLFSELATLFCGKEEYANYDHLYEGGNHIGETLGVRRKSVYQFLEDIRDIRNQFAHNKKVGPVQLALLRCHYDELIGPIDSAHRGGRTSIDPTEYFDAAREELTEYLDRMQADLRAVQDSIAELDVKIEKGFYDLSEGQTEIKSQLTPLRKALPYILGGLAVLVGLGVGSLFILNKQAADVAQATESLEQQGEVMEEVKVRAQQTVKAIEEQGQQLSEVKSDVTKAASTVTEAAQNMEDVAERVVDTTTAVVGRVAAQQKEIVGSLEQLASGFDVLKKNGRIIPDPQSPQEWYNNALKHAEAANYFEARKAYLKFMGFNLPYVDVMEGFISLLRVSDGTEGARETLEGLSRQQPDNTAVQYGKIIVQPASTRIAALETAFKETGGPVFAFRLAEDLATRAEDELDLGLRTKLVEMGNHAMEQNVQTLLYSTFLDKQVFYERADKLRADIKRSEALLAKGPVAVRITGLDEQSRFIYQVVPQDPGITDILLEGVSGGGRSIKTIRGGYEVPSENLGFSDLHLGLVYGEGRTANYTMNIKREACIEYYVDPGLAAAVDRVKMYPHPGRLAVDLYPVLLFADYIKELSVKTELGTDANHGFATGTGSGQTSVVFEDPDAEVLIVTIESVWGKKYHRAIEVPQDIRQTSKDKKQAAWMEGAYSATPYFWGILRNGKLEELEYWDNQLYYRGLMGVTVEENAVARGIDDASGAILVVLVANGDKAELNAGCIAPHGSSLSVNGQGVSLERFVAGLGILSNPGNVISDYNGVYFFDAHRDEVRTPGGTYAFAVCKEPINTPSVVELTLPGGNKLQERIDPSRMEELLASVVIDKAVNVNTPAFPGLVSHVGAGAPGFDVFSLEPRLLPYLSSVDFDSSVVFRDDWILTVHGLEQTIPVTLTFKDGRQAVYYLRKNGRTAYSWNARHDPRADSWYDRALSDLMYTPAEQDYSVRSVLNKIGAGHADLEKHKVSNRSAEAERQAGEEKAYQEQLEWERQAQEDVKRMRDQIRSQLGK